MKKFLSLLLAAAMAFSLAACRQTNAADRAASLRSENDADASAAEVSPEEPTAAADGNILIAYFSWSGNTQRVAQEVQRIAGGRL